MYRYIRAEGYDGYLCEVCYEKKLDDENEKAHEETVYSVERDTQRDAVNP